MSDDFYLDGWNMSITIDFALKGDIKEMQMEMNLSKGGSMLEIMKDYYLLLMKLTMLFTQQL